MRFIFKLALLVVLFILPSCHRNKLKTNEKALINKLYQDEREQKTADSIAKAQRINNRESGLPGGLLYKEDRSADPDHPPIEIDIAGSLDNIKEYKLSDVATEIEYVRLESPPDSAFRKDIGFKYHLTDDYIIAINSFGILQYTHDGRYVNTIVKNEFTGMEVTPEYVVSYGDMTFIGAVNPTVKSSGNKLYYSYFNNIAGQEYLMEYDCSGFNLDRKIDYDPENPAKIIGQGEIIVDLNHGRINYAPPARNREVMRNASHDYVYQGSGMNWLDDNSYMKKLRGDDMMGIFNKDGDTLSTFTQHERLVNYTKSLQRGVDTGSQYEFSSKMFFRNPFNDTVCQVIPPNRLLPVYVLNFGSFKVSRQQGVDPGFDLTGKILLEKWAENNNFIFLTFTRDNYDCIANRKSKKVKIYYALFSKLNRQLSVIKGDPFNYSPEILENNIDGGLPVWPSSYMIGNNGEILISLKGKQLKERVKSEQFRLSGAPEIKKNELKKIAASVSDYEEILMLIK